MCVVSCRSAGWLPVLFVAMIAHVAEWSSAPWQPLCIDAHPSSWASADAVARADMALAALQSRVARPIAPPSDSVVARHLGYAFAAYCPGGPEGVHAFDCVDCPASSSHAVYIRRNSTAAVAAYDRDLGTIVVSFRGSVNIRNWVDNTKFAQVSPWPDQPGVRVHKGFWASYARVRADVERAVRWVHRKSRPAATRRGRRRASLATVSATGHSLGAAMATLFVMDHAMSRPRRGGMAVRLSVTFGSPRVGAHNFAKLYSLVGPPTFRIMNTNDVVAFMPHERMVLGLSFRHVGTLHVLDAHFTRPSIVCPWGNPDPPPPCRSCDEYGDAMCHFHGDDRQHANFRSHLTYMNWTIGSAMCMGRD